jgi:hypothetical protein
MHMDVRLEDAWVSSADIAMLWCPLGGRGCVCATEQRRDKQRGKRSGLGTVGRSSTSRIVSCQA